MKDIVNSILKKALITLLICSSIATSKAQSPVYKTWVGIGFEQKLKIKKFKFKVGISQGVRLSNIVYLPRFSTFTEVGISKKITKNYKLGFTYRANYIGGFRSRLALSNALKLKLHKKISVTFRLKYQIELEKNSPFSQDFRLKTAIKWSANKDFKPYCFGEILYNHSYNYTNFNEYRLGIGLSADHKKKHNFDIMLMYVQEINMEEPRKSLVLGLEYFFSR